ncbi:MAG: hypothetical protein ABFS18_02095 [Thermodesulfobacteriota bacterium]
MAIKVFPMKQGDLLPAIRAQKVEDDGVTPIPITGSTFNLRIKKPSAVITKE